VSYLKKNPVPPNMCVRIELHNPSASIDAMALQVLKGYSLLSEERAETPNILADISGRQRRVDI
jgi:hypothetical protein